MKIRKIDYSEIELLYPLYILGYNYHYKSVPEFFPYRTDEQLKSNLEFNMKCFDKIFYIIENRNIIIGYCSITFKNTYVKSVWVNELYIKEEYQKQGYGKKLLEEIDKIGRENDCKKVELNCWAFNNNAYEFYKHLNYNDVRIIMEKEL